MSELIGAMPARGRLRGRKPAAEEPGEPLTLPVRRVTQALPERLEDSGSAERWLAAASADEQAEALIDGALALINRAIAAFRVASGRATVHEVGAEDALAIRIGFGTGDEVAASAWTKAVKQPPSRREKRRPGTEDIRPPQRVAAILAGRDSASPWELHALRARLDLESGRPAEAVAELRAALADFDASPPDFAAKLREEIVARLGAARAALDGPRIDEAALADAVDLFTRFQRRRREPPMGT